MLGELHNKAAGFISIEEMRTFQEGQKEEMAQQAEREEETVRF